MLETFSQVQIKVQVPYDGWSLKFEYEVEVLAALQASAPVVATVQVPYNSIVAAASEISTSAAVEVSGSVRWCAAVWSSHRGHRSKLVVIVCPQPLFTEEQAREGDEIAKIDKRKGKFELLGFF